MRLLTVEETHFYFKDKYKTKIFMSNAFMTAKTNDKARKYVNKKYLIQYQHGYFKYSDVMQMLKWIEHENNTICYAQQLIVDLEALCNNHIGYKTKLSKLVGITPQQLQYMNISFEVAKRIIERIENKLKSMSITAIRELKRDFIRVSND